MSESSDFTVFEVIERKGTIQIIIELGIGSATFNDLKENVEVSPSTVATRLEEGRQANIFQPTVSNADKGTETRHELTDYGEEILEIIQDGDISNIVREYQTAKRKFELASEMLANNVKNHNALVELNKYQEKSEDEIPPMETGEYGIPKMVHDYLTNTSDIEEEKLAGYIETIEELDADGVDIEKALQEMENKHGGKGADDSESDSENE